MDSTNGYERYGNNSTGKLKSAYISKSLVKSFIEKLYDNKYEPDKLLIYIERFKREHLN